MTDRTEPPAGEPAAPAPTGRHGGASGLSAAELIARARAASPELGQRPSRPARHAARQAQIEAPTDAGPARHLRIVEPHRPGAGDQPAPGGPALAGPRGVGPALATPVLDPPVLDRPAGVPGTAAGDTGQPLNGWASAAATETAPADTKPDAAPAIAPDLGRPVLASTDISIPIAAPARTSRAGRNLPAAIGVGVGLAVLIIGALAIYRPSFVIVLSIAVAIGVYEMVTAIGSAETRPPLVPLLAGVLVMEAAAWFQGPDGLVGALLLTVLGLTVWRLGDGAVNYLRDVAAGNLVALYVPFLAGFAVLMAHADDGAARIILFILTVVCSDTGGYAVGVLIGKHPMAPTVSPKKSWEGFAGSLLAGGIEGVLMMVFCFHQQWWQGALFGVAIVATATLGDLGESMIKRDLGIKDMGKLLPGHGGIMDRLDSLLPCAPVAYLLLAAFLPG
jgi:phosphatidate cytidylyltransferase